MQLDIVRFWTSYTNRPVTHEVEEPTEVEVKVPVKGPDGAIIIETRLEPRIVKRIVTRNEAVQRDFVEYSKPGYRDRATTVRSIAEIKSIEDAQPNVEDDDDRYLQMQKRDLILQHYEAWRQGHKLEKIGYPLGAWPAVTPEMAEQFRLCGISVVEEIRDLTEQTKPRVAHIGDITSLMKQAKLFLDSADSVAAANKMQSLEATNEALQEQIAEQARLMEEMRRMMVEMQQQEKPRRGRPPNSERAEDAA